MHRLKIRALLLLLPVILALVLPLTVAAAGLFAVNGANVFSGYLEPDDWLIVIEYQNTLEPYYGNDTSQDTFRLQLTTASDVLIAQTPLVAWGYMPGSIYLNANMTSALQWGSGYKVKMAGTDEANTTSYTLTSADWRGSDLTLLDNWCLAVATRIQNYYWGLGYYNSTFLVPSSTGTTKVLAGDGSIIFAMGIPKLQDVRPTLFQIPGWNPTWNTTDWTNAYVNSLPTWQDAVGSHIASIFNDTGALVGLPGQAIGGMTLFAIYLALALGTLSMGGGLAGLVLALPLLLAGWYFRLIPFAVLGIVTAIAAVVLIRQIWLKTT